MGTNGLVKVKVSDNVVVYVEAELIDIDSEVVLHNATIVDNSTGVETEIEGINNEKDFIVEVQNIHQSAYDILTSRLYQE
jgi:hypothetical protein